MKFSWNWICDYLEPNPDALEHLESKLIQAGIEVEKVEDISQFAGFEIVEITHIDKHPNADSLNICTLQGKIDRVVCGAPNVYVGMRCILANIGVVIPKTGLVLTPKTIRGIESCGMLCSGAELGLSEDSDGIFDIQNTQSIAEVLLPDGPIFDVSITPNRGDLLSVYGIARELAAFGLGKLRELDYSKIKSLDSNIPLKVSHEDVLAMHTLRLDGVPTIETPDWMKYRLNIAGFKSKSFVIDVTNYIAHDLGQPLHAFDADSITQLEVKACTGQFIDLKGNEYCVNDLCCVTSNNKIALMPGVIGGDFSKYTDSTVNVLLEAGNYAKSYIYKAQKMICNTEASRKFFYGIDPNMTKIAIAKAADIICNITGCSAGDMITAKKPEVANASTLMPIDDLNKLQIDVSIATDCLTKLGFLQTAQNTFEAPSWRHDINSPEDLLEEVIRVVGIESIQEAQLMPLRSSIFPDKFQNYLRNSLAMLGLHEIITTDYMSSQMQEIFGQSNDLHIINPMSKSQMTLRNSILKGLLEIGYEYAKYNAQTRGIFEIGRVFNSDKESIKEIPYLGICFPSRRQSNWLESNAKYDYFYKKAILERCIQQIYGNNIDYRSNSSHKYLSNACEWLFNGQVVATFGELSAEVQKKLKMKYSVCLGEVQLIHATKIRKCYETDQETITRDLSVIIPLNIETKTILAKVKEFIDQEVDITLFDLYPDALLANENRSIGLRMIWKCLQKTPTSDEISKQIGLVEQMLVENQCKVKHS